MIATGQQYSVREFITWSAAELGITLAFEGVEAEEIGRVVAVSATNHRGGRRPGSGAS